MSDNATADKPQAQKMVTAHEACNAAIGTLREIAKALKDVGDENVELDARVTSLEEERDDLKDSLEEMQPDHDQLEAWSAVIEDHRRGIVTTGELYERTVDR